MKQLTFGSVMLALVLASAGCRGKEKPDPDIGPNVEAVDSPDALMLASVNLLNAQADVFERIRDKDSAEQAEPSLHVLKRKAAILAGKSQELKMDEQTLEQQKLLDQKYRSEFEKATRRLMAESRRINADPELAKVLRKIDPGGFLK